MSSRKAGRISRRRPGSGHAHRITESSKNAAASVSATRVASTAVASWDGSLVVMAQSAASLLLPQTDRSRLEFRGERKCKEERARSLRALPMLSQAAWNRTATSVGFCNAR